MIIDEIAKQFSSFLRKFDGKIIDSYQEENSIYVTVLLRKSSLNLYELQDLLNEIPNAIIYNGVSYVLDFEWSMLKTSINSIQLNLVYNAKGKLFTTAYELLKGK